jgi:hypothetical protein
MLKCYMNIKACYRAGWCGDSVIVVYSGCAWFESRPEYRPSWGCDLSQPLHADVVPRLGFISFFLNLCHKSLINVPYRAHRYTDSFVKYRKKNERVPGESCQSNNRYGFVVFLEAYRRCWKIYRKGTVSASRLLNPTCSSRIVPQY